MKTNNLERGQILVLLALGFVVFLGFVALAIDGSRVYYERRRAQNAADSAAYAGVTYVGEKVKDVERENWDCSNWTSNTTDRANALTQAVNLAYDNDFMIDTDISDNNGVELICEDGTDKYLDIHVRITSESPTYFVHFVYSGPLVGTVDSVVRIHPTRSFAGGTAILALKDSCTPLAGQPADRTDGGAIFTGDANTIVQGGSIHSNACFNTNGTPGIVEAEDGTITYNTVWNNFGHKTVIPNPVAGPIVTVDANFPISCPGTKPADAIDVYIPGNVPSLTIDPYPKTYGDITVANGRKVILQPGLYCIYGNVNITGQMIGNSVTFYMPSSAGYFYVAGTAHVELTAPPSGCEYDSPSCSPAIGGMLIWYLPELDLGPNPDIQVTIRGDSSSIYNGTIYVPNNTIEVGGGSSTLSNLGAQLIGETVYVHGDSSLTIKYDPNMSPELPALLNLEQ